MNDADQIAKQLVDDVRKRCNDLLTLPDEWSELEDRIAAALAAERAKFADEIDRLREKNRELNRREQAATRATADAKRCFDELQKNLGGATPWVGGSLGPALLGWQLRERTEEVQTLRDRLAKFAAFADEKGEPRKVLGTLPVTADGCFYGQGADLWYVLPKGSATEVVCMTHSPYMEAYQPAYSTREAATSALDAAKEKP